MANDPEATSECVECGQPHGSREKLATADQRRKDHLRLQGEASDVRIADLRAENVRLRAGPGCACEYETAEGVNPQRIAVCGPCRLAELERERDEARERVKYLPDSREAPDQCHGLDHEALGHYRELIPDLDEVRAVIEAAVAVEKAGDERILHQVNHEDCPADRSCAVDTQLRWNIRDKKKAQTKAVRKLREVRGE